MRAVALRPGEVELSDGASLHADAIVVATGLAARTLPGQPAGVHTLRTLDDALALRSALERASSLLVIGGGFIGAEVASSARTRGLAVTVLEALPVPSARALGEELGALTGRLMTEAGVDLRTDVRIDRVRRRHGRRTRRLGVALADGARVEADVAVVGIGGVPRLGWMDDGSAASATPGGLACGPTGRVDGLPGVWAVGDVAAWPDPAHGDRHRHEHWTSAGDQAATVARDILGEPPPPPRGAVLLVRPVRAEDPAARPAGTRRQAAAAARRRPRGRRRARARWSACSPTDGWWPWRASARRASSRATAPLLQDGADGAAALELAATLSAR